MTVRVRLTAILLCALLLPGVLVGCGGREEPGQQTLEAIEGGAAEFSRGRTERVPVPPPDSGELLDELIRTYSGSWTVPRLVPISLEEMDEIDRLSDEQARYLGI